MKRILTMIMILTTGAGLAQNVRAQLSVPRTSAAFAVNHEQLNLVTGDATLFPAPGEPYYVAFTVTAAAFQAAARTVGLEAIAQAPVAEIYYTLDGSLPAVAVPVVGNGVTYKVDARAIASLPVGIRTCATAGTNYDCVSASAVQFTYIAPIPPQPIGTVVRYIVSALNSSSGLEQFANTNCVSPACATVFTYIVGAKEPCAGCVPPQ